MQSIEVEVQAKPAFITWRNCRDPVREILDEWIVQAAGGREEARLLPRAHESRGIGSLSQEQSWKLAHGGLTVSAGILPACVWASPTRLISVLATRSEAWGRDATHASRQDAGATAENVMPRYRSYHLRICVRSWFSFLAGAHLRGAGGARRSWASPRWR
ncbi:hypothetical protein HS125_08465 [bacterium]|nr:hypothetical protein [bacterium]